MATGFNVSRYRSLNRPSSSGGSFSSYASSLVKKTNSAEDAIVDQQYSDGLLSAESYKLELTKRLSRSYITPLQKVTLTQKMSDVDQTLADSKIDQLYKTGQIKTIDVLKYEQQKLANMTEQDSVAYQQQAAKVQGLKDKSERESRSAYRTQQDLAIANMPEDSSERLTAKANEYAKLEAQARVDGDTAAADRYAVQKINYTNSANRANINDFITKTKLSISGTPTQGMGVPSAGEGYNYYLKLLGKTPGSGTPTSFGSKTLENLYEGLDRGQKSLNRMYGQLNDQQQIVDTYNKAAEAATGDQKTQLLIAANNAKDEMARIENSISIQTQNLQDIVGRVQTEQSGIAYSSFRKNASAQEQALKLSESQLERDLRSGKINKDQYLLEVANITRAKTELLQGIAEGYRQFGKDDDAAKVDDTISSLLDSKAGQIYQTIQDSNITDQNQLVKLVQQIGSNYELFRVDKDGTLDNISGKGLKRGDLTLKDFSSEKEMGTFNMRYVEDGGVYHEIKYPGGTDPLTGLPDSLSLRDIVESGQGQSPYYIGADGQKHDLKVVESQQPDGSKTQQVVKASVVENNSKFQSVENLRGDKKPILYRSVDPNAVLAGDIGKNIVDTGSKILSGAKDFLGGIRGGLDQQVQKTQELMNQNKTPQINLSPTGEKVKGLFDQSRGYIQNALNNAGTTAGNLLGGIKGAISGAGNFLGNLTSGLKSQIRPFQVQAEGVGTTGTRPYEDYVRQVWGNDMVDEWYQAMSGENGQHNPTLDFTGNRDKSIDRGLMQINSNTFNDIKKRYPNTVAKLGVTSYADLHDPLKNIAFGKLVFDDRSKWDTSGWNAWYGAPDYLKTGKKPVEVISQPHDATPADIVKINADLNKPKVAKVDTLAEVNRKANEKALLPVTPTGTPAFDPIKAIQNMFAPRQMLSPVPDSMLLRSNQPSNPIQNFADNVSSGLRSAASQIQLPKISVPQITLPKVNVPQISIPQINLPKVNVQPIQQAAQNIGNKVGSAVQGATDWLKKTVGSWFGR